MPKLAFVGGLVFAGTLLGLLAPWPLKVIVDSILGGAPLPRQVVWIKSLPAAGTAAGQIGWLALATVCLFLLSRATSILQDYVQAGAGSRMVYRLAEDVYAQLLSRSPLFHARHRIGDLVRRVTADTGCVRDLIFKVYVPLLKSAVTVLLMFVIIWSLSHTLALFAIGLALPLGILVRIFARRMSDRRFLEWEVQGEVASQVEQTLTAIPVVQAFGREEIENQRFRQLAGKTVQATLHSELSQHQFKVSTGAVNAVAKAIVIVVGGIAVLDARLTVGELLVLVSYFLAFYSPIETIAYLSEGFAAAGAGARRIYGLLESGDHESKVSASDDGQPTVDFTPGPTIRVRFEDVTFGYEPGQPVLAGVSLEFKPGEIVALIGPTGAGKSTLVGLLLRFFDPWQGSIHFNGRETRTIPLTTLREQISLVPQEPFLLPLSIAENIAYGRPGASKEQIVAAAVAAQADEFITRLPLGYDTVIGERGTTLSGGEKQRLSIARAILKDAPLLLLDEPTSALDGQVEAAVLRNLRQLRAGRTTLLIAHRLSTIRQADRLIFLQAGQIVEEGHPDELRTRGGPYARLCETTVSRGARSGEMAVQSLASLPQIQNLH
jgi:ATP-binding cassette subfamily B protein/subfamily B ATP-binding cassette protein MsbA